MRFLVVAGLRSRFLVAVGWGWLSPPCPETSQLSRSLPPGDPLHTDFSLASSSNTSRENPQVLKGCCDQLRWRIVSLSEGQLISNLHYICKTPFAT